MCNTVWWKRWKSLTYFACRSVKLCKATQLILPLRFFQLWRSTICFLFRAIHLTVILHPSLPKVNQQFPLKNSQLDAFVWGPPEKSDLLQQIVFIGSKRSFLVPFYTTNKFPQSIWSDQFYPKWCWIYFQAKVAQLSRKQVVSKSQKTDTMCQRKICDRLRCNLSKSPWKNRLNKTDIELCFVIC